jgi:putative oxidoreductase
MRGGCGLLVQSLLAAKRDLRLQKAIKQLSRFDGLILDDLGYVQHSREEMEVLVMGVAFLFHGWPKIQNPLGWMGADAPVPGILQGLAALAEFGGGMALIVGLLTRLAALGIATNMVVAIGMVHLPKGDPFVNTRGSSYELAAIYLACAVLFLLLGPGRFALDALLFGKPFGEKPRAPG